MCNICLIPCCLNFCKLISQLEKNFKFILGVLPVSDLISSRSWLLFHISLNKSFVIIIQPLVAPSTFLYSLAQVNLLTVFIPITLWTLVNLSCACDNGFPSGQELHFPFCLGPVPMHSFVCGSLVSGCSIHKYGGNSHLQLYRKSAAG